MQATDQLDDLFIKWERHNYEYKDKFVKDGIINENIYKQQHIKLLFIAKEQNDTKQQPGDFRDWWQQEIKYVFANRIYEMAFGVLNNFPPLDEVDSNSNKLGTLGAIAFMNLKKIGGGANADHEAIAQTVNQDKKFILEEIRIINPDIIIGGVGATNIWRTLFDGIKFERCYDILIAKHGSYKIIDYYHPSYRVPRAMNYSLLQNVVNSNEFERL